MTYTGPEGCKDCGSHGGGPPTQLWVFSGERTPCAKALKMSLHYSGIRGKAFGQREQHEQVWRSETAQLVGMCKKREEFGITEPRIKERPGGVATAGNKEALRGRWGCLAKAPNTTLKNSGFILFQLNKSLTSCTRGRNKVYSLASAYFVSTPVSNTKLWVSCRNINVFTRA